MNMGYGHGMAVTYHYILGLGSNRAGPHAARPRLAVEKAVDGLAADDRLALLSRSPVFETLPWGPGRRRYANAAVRVATALEPMALLILLKEIEREAGRRRGRRWGDRVLDIDIVLWSAGRFRHRRLHIPHRDYHRRGFVLDPLCAIAPAWRDRHTTRTPAQWRARLHRHGNKG